MWMYAKGVRFWSWSLSVVRHWLTLPLNREQRKTLSERLLTPTGAQDENGWHATAQALYATRIAPLRAWLEETPELPVVRRIVVVPAGDMQSVPLEVLLTEWPGAPSVSYVANGIPFFLFVNNPG